MATATAKRPQLEIVEYRWREGAKFRLPASIVGPEIESVINEGDGDPASVLKAMEKRPRQFKTLSLLTTDAQKALKNQRVQEMSKIMGSVVVVDVSRQKEAPKIRAFIPVYEVPTAGTESRRRWFSTSEIEHSPQLAEKVVARAKHELKMAASKYQSYKRDLAPFYNAMGEMGLWEEEQ